MECLKEVIKTFLVGLDLFLQLGQLSRIHLALLALHLQGFHPLLKTSGLLLQYLQYSITHVHISPCGDGGGSVRLQNFVDKKKVPSS